MQTQDHFSAKQGKPFHGMASVGFSLQEDFYDYQIWSKTLDKSQYSP